MSLQQDGRQGKLFIGLWLPERVAAALGQDNAELESIDGVAIARQPHVTLAYLAEVPDSAVPILADALAQIAARTRPIQLSIEGRGAFPSRSRPRVLWYGVAGEIARLEILVREIRRETLSLVPGQDAKPFRAHITAGRIRGSVEASVVAPWLGRRRAVLEWDVEQIALICRFLGRPYETVRSFPLEG